MAFPSPLPNEGRSLCDGRSPLRKVSADNPGGKNENNIMTQGSEYPRLKIGCHLPLCMDEGGCYLVCLNRQANKDAPNRSHRRPSKKTRTSGIDRPPKLMYSGTLLGQNWSLQVVHYKVGNFLNPLFTVLFPLKQGVHYLFVEIVSSQGGDFIWGVLVRSE